VPTETNNELTLSVKNLKKYFPVKTGMFKSVSSYIKAVDDISFDLYEGETVGLVGESGCGKTTAGRSIIRAIDPTEGTVDFYPEEDERVEFSSLPRKDLRRYRRHIQYIFQDPYSSLDPRQNIFDIISEPLKIKRQKTGAELKEFIIDLMEKTGLRKEYLNRYPHAFSGGQRQRIGIARALTLGPKILICDEPVSALDVSIQAQILNLFQDLQEEFNLSYLFISHDLSVVRHMCDRTLVMYSGRLVESATNKDLFENPKHPYTEALLASLPKPHPKYIADMKQLEGEVADPGNPPDGCYFHPRCVYKKEICQKEYPQLKACGDDRRVSCHFADELSLKGI
jgi:peptide/nickel transport system ATP-binding protein